LVPVKRIDTIEAAVQAARDIALSGDVVLLSPACASLDMFRDFNHRGQVFTDLVGKL
jgi:UDP-N-acetylmuramoylalanine--D-glutamate ligase